MYYGKLIVDFEINKGFMFETSSNGLGKPLESKGLYLRIKFSEEYSRDLVNEKFTDSLWVTETTQPYQILFYFLNLTETNQKAEKDMLVPFFGFDDDLFTDMALFMTEEQIDAFFKNYVNLAEMAEHDYVHAISLSAFEDSDVFWADSNDDDKFYGPRVERHTLVLHSDILQSGFNRVPKRKEKVLSYGQEAYTLLANSQKSIEEIEDYELRCRAESCLTALTETLSHRFFRIFSPNAPELDMEDKNGISINANIENIDILMDSEMLDPEMENTWDLSNKERLLINLSIVKYFASNLGDVKLQRGIYEDIHGVNGLDIKQYLKGLEDQGSQESEWVSSIEVLKKTEDHMREGMENTL